MAHALERTCSSWNGFPDEYIYLTPILTSDQVDHRNKYVFEEMLAYLMPNGLTYNYLKLL